MKVKVLKTLWKKETVLEGNDRTMDITVGGDGPLCKTMKYLKKNWLTVLASIASIVAAVFSALSYFKG